jgi:hypothetical protein
MEFVQSDFTIIIQLKYLNFVFQWYPNKGLHSLKFSKHYPLDFNTYIYTFHKIPCTIYEYFHYSAIHIQMHDLQNIIFLPPSIVGKCCLMFVTLITLM